MWPAAEPNGVRTRITFDDPKLGHVLTDPLREPGRVTAVFHPRDAVRAGGARMLQIKLPFGALPVYEEGEPLWTECSLHSGQPPAKNAAVRVVTFRGHGRNRKPSGNLIKIVRPEADCNRAVTLAQPSSERERERVLGVLVRDGQQFDELPGTDRNDRVAGSERAVIATARRDQPVLGSEPADRGIKVSDTVDNVIDPHGLATYFHTGTRGCAGGPGEPVVQQLGAGLVKVPNMVYWPLMALDGVSRVNQERNASSWRW